MINKNLCCAAEPRGDYSQAQGDDDTTKIINRKKIAHPVALGVPPDLILLEPANVGRIQNEPMVIPHHAPDKVHCPGHDFINDTPRSSHEKLRVKNKSWKNEHERVVPSERFPVQQAAVNLGG